MKMKTKTITHLLLTSALLLIAFGSKAQTPYYQLVKSNQTYTELPAPTPLTIDTNISGNYINEPSFNFNLFGRPYIFSAYNNGNDSSDGAFVSWFGTMILADTVNNHSALIDLINEDGSQLITGETEISYQLSGMFGSRILKVQWKNIGSDTALNAAARLNCQVWFLEQTQEIVFHYGNCIAGNPSGFKPGISLVLLSNTAYEIPEAAIVSGTPSNDSLQSFINITNYNTFLTILSTNYFSGVPANGTMYRFVQAATGVNDMQTQPLLNVFPNPASNQITLQTSRSLTVQITNAFGQQVKTVQLQSGNNIIETETLPQGIYFVHSSNQLLTKFTKL